MLVIMYSILQLLLFSKDIFLSIMQTFILAGFGWIEKHSFSISNNLQIITTRGPSQ